MSFDARARLPERSVNRKEEGDAEGHRERVARKFHDLFPASELFLLPGARHYVQVDEPEEVARLILPRLPRRKAFILIQSEPTGGIDTGG
jgi:hypothetical protein